MAKAQRTRDIYDRIIESAGSFRYNPNAPKEDDSNKALFDEVDELLKENAVLKSDLELAVKKKEKLKQELANARRKITNLEKKLKEAIWRLNQVMRLLISQFLLLLLLLLIILLLLILTKFLLLKREPFLVHQ
jgi:predicted  nucleic acid-binding Zn-ribbon protein